MIVYKAGSEQICKSKQRPLGELIFASEFPMSIRQPRINDFSSKRKRCSGGRPAQLPTPWFIRQPSLRRYYRYDINKEKFTVSAQKSRVGAASAAWEPCALRLKTHLQKLISGQHMPGLRKAIPPIIELMPFAGNLLSLSRGRHNSIFKNMPVQLLRLHGVIIYRQTA